MSIDNYTAALAHILKRAYEETGSDGDFYDLAGDALVMAWRDLWSMYQIKEWTKDPPAAFVTVADLTTLTLTVAAAGESVAGTLSAIHATSLAGYKITPSGAGWTARITAHTAGTAAITIDAAPAAVTAGTACVIFKDEYDLASDLGTFVDGLWTQDGIYIPLVSEEVLNGKWPYPPDGSNTPSAFTRLTRRKIRLSHYPLDIKRIEYAYYFEPADPSGSDEVALPDHWRMAWVESALHLLLDMKFDRRAGDAFRRAQVYIEKAVAYERRRITGHGYLLNQRHRAAYGA